MIDDATDPEVVDLDADLESMSVDPECTVCSRYDTDGKFSSYEAFTTYAELTNHRQEKHRKKLHTDEDHVILEPVEVWIESVKITLREIKEPCESLLKWEDQLRIYFNGLLEDPFKFENSQVNPSIFLPCEEYWMC